MLYCQSKVCGQPNTFKWGKVGKLNSYTFLECTLGPLWADFSHLEQHFKLVYTSQVF